MESKHIKRSGEGKRFRRIARTLGSIDGEPAILKKRQDESSDSRLRRISMTVGLSSLRTLERETGFEPATSTLARLHSTTELLPHRKLLFILWPRVLSTGRDYEISNAGKSQYWGEKIFVICQCSFVIAQKSPNVHWALKRIASAMTNDKSQMENDKWTDLLIITSHAAAPA